MPDKLKNIIEDVARDFLNSSLSLRYDICTCPICRNDMLAYVLSHVPAKYVTTEEGAIHTIIQQTRVEHQAQIARAIIQAVELVSKNPRHKLKEDKNKVFQLLLDKIRDDRNLDFHHYHQDLLKRRVAVRLRSLNLETYSEYLRMLISNPEEYDKLFEVLCINVSEFFRDGEEVWGPIRKAFEATIRRKKIEGNRTLRVWSAGCACGEEPHTLAVLLRDLLGPEYSGFNVEIVATDVDKKCMDEAKIGDYPKERLKNVDKKIWRSILPTWAKYVPCQRRHSRDYQLRLPGPYNPQLCQNVDFVLCRNVFTISTAAFRSTADEILQGLTVAATSSWANPKALRRSQRNIDPVDANARLYKKKHVRLKPHPVNGTKKYNIIEEIARASINK
jgi:chemotaxis methyl-accepting protein methylase